MVSSAQHETTYAGAGPVVQLATVLDCDRAFDCLAALCHHVHDLGMEELALALEDALDACLAERARLVPPPISFASRRAPRRPLSRLMLTSEYRASGTAG